MVLYSMSQFMIFNICLFIKRCNQIHIDIFSRMSLPQMVSFRPYKSLIVAVLVACLRLLNFSPWILDWLRFIDVVCLSNPAYNSTLHWMSGLFMIGIFS